MGGPFSKKFRADPCNLWEDHCLLCWCTSCSGKRQSRAETSAPPEVSSFCVNLCNLWENHSARSSVKSAYSVGEHPQQEVLCRSVQSVGGSTVCLVGALLALASSKAERRQVHPLKLKSVGELSQKLSDYEKKRNFALIARR